MAGDDKCIACMDELPSDGRLMTCAEYHIISYPIRISYHIGQNCSGIAANTFTTMGQTKHDNWVCKTCRTAKKRGGSGAQGVGPATDSGEVLSGLMEEVKGLHIKLDAFLFLKTEVSELATTVREMEASVYFVSKRYNSVMDELKSAQEKVATQEVEMKSLREMLQTQSHQIEQLLREQNDAEQYSRRANMEITGLNLAQNENLSEWIEKLVELLEVPKFSSEDIVRIHRLPAKQGAIPAVLVRFASVAIKETWFGLRGKLRQLHDSDTISKLFFNENFTRANRRLFRLQESLQDKGLQVCLG
ncbi:hypothetical protein HPB48_022786 [Haemaphysalis longicornis]|uniref:Uncharacterized protein n=1 Tax=Haemaphysalis longicornis TaxID=44386 RepID=A0A9J6FY07_HAELO|nr:hypothetical protein HPB48_022786 [Haemaphysalis longicornis]